jgi:hypothetical protein
MGFDDEKLLGGICRVIENLVELPLSTKAEVSAALRKLSRPSAH